MYIGIIMFSISKAAQVIQLFPHASDKVEALSIIAPVSPREQVSALELMWVGLKELCGHNLVVSLLP